MKTNTFKTKACVCALLVSAVTVCSATAQAQSQDRVVLGVGAAMMPVYQGADDYRVTPIPAIDIKKGWFFANLRNGLGIKPIDTEHVTVGTSVVFIPGYRSRDVPEGVDKLSRGVGGRVFTSVRAGGFITSLGVVKMLSGDAEGIVADASISYPIRLSSNFSLTPSLAATWSDAKYNDSYFGITAAESLASGLPQYTGEAGFKDVSGLLTASYRMTDRITLSLTGGVTSLDKDLTFSPLVEKRTQSFGIFMLTYRM